MQKNLPVTSVRDIDVHSNDLVIGTHGRSFWIMDDVTPLRQTAAAVSARGAFLFAPAIAIRERASGFTGTPMPKDEALAPNPPNGAYIDYLLRTPAAQPITLEIFDANNTLVRRYSSADVAPVADPTKLRTAPEWFATPVTLRTSAGMHRFVWPLRYAARAAGSTAYSNGVWAPPGTYSVVLTIDGQRLKQPLQVDPDPRVSVTASAYSEQFTLARKVEELQIEIAAALEEAGTLVPKLRAEKQDALADRAVALSDVNLTDAWWLLPSSTTSLRFVDGALEKLAGAIDGADAAPTQDARAGWEKVQPLAANALRAWKEFVAALPKP
jgi:hypothetical protein